MSIQHPTPAWTVAALGGISALILPALKPELLPEGLQRFLAAGVGVEGLQRLAIAAAVVHLIEMSIALRTGLKNKCSPAVTAWYMLMAFLYGYPGLVLLLRQTKQE